MPKEDATFNRDLVKAIRKHPCLYDNTSSEYNVRVEVYKAWEVVANEMNESVDACRSMWRNIRTVIGRHLRTSKIEPLSQVRKYYLYDDVKFIIPFLKPGERSKNSKQDGSIKQSNSINDDSVSFEDTINVIKMEQYDNDDAAIEDLHDDGSSFIEEHWHNMDNGKSSVPDLEHLSPLPSTSISSSTNFKRKRDTSPQKSIEQSLTTKSLLDSSSSVLSSKKMFLLSLMPDLDEMNSAQMRKFRIEVAKLIDNILSDEKPNEN